MELTNAQILDYINFLEAKHRATREALLKEGKTYRSRFVAYESGYLNALRDVRDTINQPKRNEELGEALKHFPG